MRTKAFLRMVIAGAFLLQSAAGVLAQTATAPATKAPAGKAPASAPAKSAAQTVPGKASGKSAASTTLRAASDLPRIPIEKYTLANGLDVILVEDHKLPLVAVNIWYHVGAVNEAAGRTGFAHLFEHMMFQGSKNVPPDGHIRLMEGVGATDLNASTDFDRTNYYQTVPPNQLELVLWLESDRMGWLLDKVDQAMLSNQQDVVRNERRQGVENTPYGIAEERLYQALFPAGHPYHGYVIGSHADLVAAKLDDVREFFKTYYRPNNASLVIAGDISKPAVKALVEKYFGSLRQGAAVPPVAATTPRLTSERRLVVTDRIELSRVYMAWLTPPILKPGDAEADIAADILGGGKSSRLYKKLVYEKQIAQDVTASQYSLTLGSVFTVQATARPGVSLADLEKAMEDELSRLRADGPDAKEVERSRNRAETNIVKSIETLGGSGLADHLNRYNHHLKNPDFVAGDILRYRNATPEAVHKFAQEYLKPSARVVLHAVPGEQQLAAEPPKAEKPPEGKAAISINANEAWRAKPPNAGAARALRLPTPAQFELANGMKVIVDYRPGLPVVSANLVVRTGSDANPLEKPGLANFTVAMLDEGTATRDALGIADELAQLGAAFRTSSSMDGSFIIASSLSKNFPALLDLMADVALRPSLPAEEIERQRKIRIGQFSQIKEDPGSIANRIVAAALYGSKHPYGYLEIGTESSVKAISRDDMVAYWKQNFVPKTAALIVAGNITPAALRPLAEKAFGGWQRGTPASPALGGAQGTSAQLILVDKPGAAQTELRFASIGVARSSPDYAAISVMNNTLGGLFNSRINMNLREEKGFTYGAGSFFSFRRGPGPFQVVAPVQTDATAPAITEVLKEIKRMREEPVATDEMNLSRDSLVRSLPADFESSGNAAGSFSNIYLYDLGLDYYAKYPSLIGGITPQAVQAAAQKYVVPEKLVIVAVGDLAKIAPELKKLNLGVIERRDVEGNIKP